MDKVDKWINTISKELIFGGCQMSLPVIFESSFPLLFLALRISTVMDTPRQIVSRRRRERGMFASGLVHHHVYYNKARGVSCRARWKDTLHCCEGTHPRVVGLLF